MRDHRNLRVWWAAHTLSADLHRLLDAMPRLRIPGLRSQLLRAASSVPTNIVEGCGAESDAEFARFLEMALKSVKELEYHVLRLYEAGHLDPGSYGAWDERVTLVRRSLYALTMRVRGRGRRRRVGER